MNTKRFSKLNNFKFFISHHLEFYKTNSVLIHKNQKWFSSCLLCFNAQELLADAQADFDKLYHPFTPTHCRRFLRSTKRLNCGRINVISMDLQFKWCPHPFSSSSNCQRQIGLFLFWWNNSCLIIYYASQMCCGSELLLVQENGNLQIVLFSRAPKKRQLLFN